MYKDPSSMAEIGSVGYYLRRSGVDRKYILEFSADPDIWTLSSNRKTSQPGVRKCTTHNASTGNLYAKTGTDAGVSSTLSALS